MNFWPASSLETSLDQLRTTDRLDRHQDMLHNQGWRWPLRVAYQVECCLFQIPSTNPATRTTKQVPWCIHYIHIYIHTHTPTPPQAHIYIHTHTLRKIPRPCKTAKILHRVCRKRAGDWFFLSQPLLLCLPPHRWAAAVMEKGVPCAAQEKFSLSQRSAVCLLGLDFHWSSRRICRQKEVF